MLDDTKASIDNYDNLLRVAYKNNNSNLTKDDIISILPNDSNKQSNIEKLNMAASLGADLSSTTVIKKQITDLGIDSDGTLVKNIVNLETALNGVLQIEDGYNLYNSKINELNSYKSELENGKSLYYSYLNEYKNGYILYNQTKLEFDNKLNQFNDATKELSEKESIAALEFEKARNKVDETIVPGTWLIRNRLDNIDYENSLKEYINNK